MIDVLRPATIGAIKPYEIENVLGTKAIARYADGQGIALDGFGSVITTCHCKDAVGGEATDDGDCFATRIALVTNFIYENPLFL